MPHGTHSQQGKINSFFNLRAKNQGFLPNCYDTHSVGKISSRSLRRSLSFQLRFIRSDCLRPISTTTFPIYFVSLFHRNESFHKVETRPYCEEQNTPKYNYNEWDINAVPYNTFIATHERFLFSLAVVSGSTPCFCGYLLLR